MDFILRNFTTLLDQAADIKLCLFPLFPIKKQINRNRVNVNQQQSNNKAKKKRLKFVKKTELPFNMNYFWKDSEPTCVKRLKANDERFVPAGLEFVGVCQARTILFKQRVKTTTRWRWQTTAISPSSWLPKLSTHMAWVFQWWWPATESEWMETKVYIVRGGKDTGQPVNGRPATWQCPTVI